LRWKIDARWQALLGSSIAAVVYLAKTRIASPDFPDFLAEVGIIASDYSVYAPPLSFFRLRARADRSHDRNGISASHRNATLLAIRSEPAATENRYRPTPANKPVTTPPVSKSNPTHSDSEQTAWGAYPGTIRNARCNHDVVRVAPPSALLGSK
jgi:hypothetical protein